MSGMVTPVPHSWSSGEILEQEIKEELEVESLLKFYCKINTEALPRREGGQKTTP